MIFMITKDSKCLYCVSQFEEGFLLLAGKSLEKKFFSDSKSSGNSFRKCRKDRKAQKLNNPTTQGL